MFQVSWPVVVVYWMFYACVGMAIGAVVGLAIRSASKAKITGVAILVSGVIGVCGFFAGIIGTLMTPWPTTTESRFEGGSLVTSTMRGYQHPDRIGCLVALLFSLAWALYRVRRDRSGQALHRD
jgi:hypothetical protein